MNAKQTAAAVRTHLRNTFPGARPSVRMCTGSAHGWLTVSWTDGPTEAQVLDATAAFRSSEFDGSDDAYHATGNTGVTCRGVTTVRRLTPEALASVDPTTGDARALAAEYRMDEPELRRVLAKGASF